MLHGSRIKITSVNPYYAQRLRFCCLLKSTLVVIVVQLCKYIMTNARFIVSLSQLWWCEMSSVVNTS